MKHYLKAISLILCAAVTFCGCSAQEEQVEETTATAVNVVSVEKTDIGTEYTYTGKLNPIKSVDIIAKTAGEVKNVNFEVGDAVKAGDIIFEVDTDDYISSYNSAKAGYNAAAAAVSQAQTALTLAEGANKTTTEKQVEVALINAESAYETAKSSYETTKALYEVGAVSKTDYDNVEYQYKVAEASYEQAKTTYDATINEILPNNIKAAEGTLASANAQLESAKAQLESIETTLADAKVTSPIDGVITSLNVEEFNMVSSSTIPVSVADLSSMKVNVSVSEQVINSIEPGQSVDVIVNAVSSEPINATINSVSPAANMTGTYDVEIEIDNTDGNYKGGMVCQVSFVKDKKEGVTVVPRNSVVTKDGENYVFVINENKAEKRIVEMGIESGDYVEILSGVSEGESVVSKGQTYLNDGDEVTVTQ